MADFGQEEFAFCREERKGKEGDSRWTYVWEWEWNEMGTRMGEGDMRPCPINFGEKGQHKSGRKEGKEGREVREMGGGKRSLDGA
jgi:hypothetical protein